MAKKLRYITVGEFNIGKKFKKTKSRWKKITDYDFSFVKNIDSKKHEPTYVDVYKDGNEYEFRVNVGDSFIGQDSAVIRKRFKNKSQALKYAKSYMRKH